MSDVTPAEASANSSDVDTETPSDDLTVDGPTREWTDSEASDDVDGDLQSAAHILSQPGRNATCNDKVYQGNWVAQVFVRYNNGTLKEESVTEQHQMRILADNIFSRKEALRFKQAHDCVQDFYDGRMPTVRTYAQGDDDDSGMTTSPTPWSQRRHQQECNRLHGPKRHACQLFLSGQATVCKATGNLLDVAVTHDTVAQGPHTASPMTTQQPIIGCITPQAARNAANAELLKDSTATAVWGPYSVEAQTCPAGQCTNDVDPDMFCRLCHGVWYCSRACRVLHREEHNEEGCDPAAWARELEMKQMAGNH
jgi:hypothetical protein